MKRKLNNAIGLVSGFLLLFASCKDNAEEDNVPKVSVTGTVDVRNEFGNQQADKSGVKVSLTNEDPKYSTETNAAGEFTLSAPQGIHQLIFEKPGYATVITDNPEDFGTGQSYAYPYKYLVAQIPNATISNLKVEREQIPGPGIKSMIFTGDFSNVGMQNKRAPVFYFGSTPQVSYQNYTLVKRGPSAQFTSNPVFAEFEPDDFRNAGFQMGQTIYVVAHCYNPVNATIANPVTHQLGFTAINPTQSNVASFVLTYY